jgi:hypothetical protein
MRCNTGPCRKPDAINIQSGLLVVSGDIRSFDPRGQFFPLQLLWRNTSLGQRVCMHDTSESRKNERAENFRITGSHNPFPFPICPRHKPPRRSAQIETNGVAIGNRECPLRVNMRNTQCKQMLSALAPIADSCEHLDAQAEAQFSSARYSGKLLGHWWSAVLGEVGASPAMAIFNSSTHWKEATQSSVH